MRIKDFYRAVNAAHRAQTGGLIAGDSAISHRLMGLTPTRRRQHRTDADVSECCAALIADRAAREATPTPTRSVFDPGDGLWKEVDA